MVVEKASQKILWIGPSSEVPESFLQCADRQEVDRDFLWMPAWIDCHTHLVFSGSRVQDFSDKCDGVTSQALLAQGRGILETVRATRQSSIKELVSNAAFHLQRFKTNGVSVLEIKSGYGLNWESELKMLEAMVELAKQNPEFTLIRTFLGAHALAPEWVGRRREYVELLCREWIPEIARRRLVYACDAYMEEGYFNKAEVKKMAEATCAAGLKLRLHTNQYSNLGGIELGLDMKAVALDHLDIMTPHQAEQIAQSETVAVLLPGATLFTRSPIVPARRLLDAGARVAISTDFNPGTCPSHQLALMGTLACTQLQMSIPEWLASVTFNAALALGCEKELGTLEVGKKALVTKIRVPHEQAIPYSYGELSFGP